ncbi:WecB/TagA/CpsF family glycosyltransferase [Actinoplanes xinjiangensis]|uniref:WecB/TagA/CpsF family glycosyltransferase n=1 Tax=Actinoplanes xinjiangensis TaxID=512350 RepID=UPI003425CB26
MTIEAFDRVHLDGTGIDRITEDEVVAVVRESLAHGRGGRIITPNVDILRRASADPGVRRHLDDADLIVADGMPLVWASRLGGSPLPERVAGSSLIWSLSEGLGRDARSIFIIGGTPATLVSPGTAATRATAATGGTAVIRAMSAKAGSPVAGAMSAKAGSPVAGATSAKAGSPVAGATSATGVSRVAGATSATSGSPVIRATPAIGGSPVTGATSATGVSPVIRATPANAGSPVTAATSAIGGSHLTRATGSTAGTRGTAVTGATPATGGTPGTAPTGRGPARRRTSGVTDLSATPVQVPAGSHRRLGAAETTVETSREDPVRAAESPVRLAEGGGARTATKARNAGRIVDRDRTRRSDSSGVTSAAVKAALGAAAAVKAARIAGKDGAARAADRLTEAFPGLRIAGTLSPDYGFEEDESTYADFCAKVVAAQPDLVFVGLGFPKQELVIERLRPDLPNAWFVGCGAAVNFVAGDIERAPLWMQRTGLEWAHRLGIEPRRLAGRYLRHDAPYALRLLARAPRRRSLRP